MPDNEKTEADVLEAKIKASFDKLIKAGKTEDEVKMGMIAAGASFKNVTRLYNAFAVDSGLVLGKDEKAKLIESAMKGADVTTEEGFKGVVDKVLAGGSAKGMTEASAASLIRRAAKAANIEAWKKPKGEGKGASGFANGFYNWLRANPTATVEKATAFIMGADGNAETSNNVQNHIKHYLNIHSVVVDIATGGQKKAA